MGYGLQKGSFTGNGKYVACALLRNDDGIGGYVDLSKKGFTNDPMGGGCLADPEHMTKLFVITFLFSIV